MPRSVKKQEFVVGADHAGYKIKEFIKAYLARQGYEVEDVGTFSTESVDYPIYAEKVALGVKRKRNALGILACGTGIGAAIAANKIPGIRAALVANEREARLSIEHNNANILTLGGRPFSAENVRGILRAWLAAEFEGGRHLRRVREIEALERKYCKRSA
jgi:ribose 5-phosphate isomerase B